MKSASSNIKSLSVFFFGLQPEYRTHPMTARVAVSITQALPVCFLKLCLQPQHTFLPSCMIGNNSTCRLKLLTYLFQLLVKSTCPSMPCRCSKNLPPQQQTSPNKLIQPQQVELETPHNFPSPTYVWPSNNNCMPAGRDIAVGTWMNWTFFWRFFWSWPVVSPWFHRGFTVVFVLVGFQKRVVWWHIFSEKNSFWKPTIDLCNT